MGADSHPVFDLAYVGANGRGRMFEDGEFPGHVWIEVSGDLIDFCCGDWMADTLAQQTRSGMPAIRWLVHPPEFVWRPVATVRLPPGGGALRLGHVAYVALSSEAAPVADRRLRVALSAFTRPPLDAALRMVARQVRALATRSAAYG